MTEHVEPDLGYGPRLSLEEYERRLTALYGDSRRDDPGEVVLLRERQEFDLTVDHKLGVAFPADRREALWQAQEQVRKRRYRWFLWNAAHRVLPRAWASRADPRRLLEREYGSVLGDRELAAFLDDGSRPEPATK